MDELPRIKQVSAGKRPWTLDVRWKDGSESRIDLTDKNCDNFGHLFIVLPNPMYGDWETALYQVSTEEQKATVRRQLLHSWR